jgi:hypothetical protein
MIEFGMAIFWTIYDIIPLMLLFKLHKENLSTFDSTDEHMICEMTFDSSNDEDVPRLMMDNSTSTVENDKSNLTLAEED